MLVGLPLELRGSVVPENGGFVNVKSGCNTTFFPYASKPGRLAFGYVFPGSESFSALRV